MTLSQFEPHFRKRFSTTSSVSTAVMMVLCDVIGILLSFGWGFIWVEAYGWTVMKDPGFIDLKSFVTYWPYLPIFVVIFQTLGLYPGISLAPSEEMRRFSLGSALAYGGVVFSRLVENQSWDAVNTAFIISLVFSALILLTMRGIFHRLLRLAGWKGIPSVVYGSGATARRVVDRMLDSTRVGYVPSLILDDDVSGVEEYRGVPIIHDTGVGPEIVKRFNIKMAIIAVDRQEPEKLKLLIGNSASAFRYHVIIPDFFNITNIWMSVRDFDGLLGFVTSHKLSMPWNLWIKRIADVLVVSVGGLILLPALLVVALLVRFSSPGPILYGHTRLGRDGKPFRALKFRSMAVDSQQRLEKLLASDPEIRREWEESRKLKNDPRITKLGKFLRRTSIDEFPQFINILKGEMSLVGPRPITDEETGKYGDDFSWIFSVRPGLTGLWQVSGRSQKDYATRVSYDTYYLQSWSVWLDMWIVYKTFGVVLRGKGAY